LKPRSETTDDFQSPVHGTTITVISRELRISRKSGSAYRARICEVTRD
jgi:hypothetical protein